jgi:choline dehydrogenase-like flavoprotein
MLLDTRSLTDGTVLDTDLCVIGAGAAGITLARQFIGRQTRVVVLESGGLDFEANTQQLSAGEETGLPYYPLDTARIRMFGGTTLHWGGVCRVPDAVDFEPRDWIPGSGWPIGRPDLDPYYPRARDICGLPNDGESDDTLGARDSESPLPFQGGDIETRLVRIVPSQQRGFGKRFRRELEQAPNVTVQLHATVTRIETDEVGASATSVEAATLDGRRITVRARVFVVAAGGIDNPRMLLLSNRVRPAGMGNEQDLVGRYFLEHPRYVAGMAVLVDPTTPLRIYEHHRVGPSTVQGYLVLSREKQAEEGLLDVQILVRATYIEPFKRALDSDVIDDAKDLRDELTSPELSQLGHDLSAVIQDLTRWQSYAVPGAPLPVPYPEVVGELLRATPPQAQSLIPEVLGDLIGAAYGKIYGAPVESLTLRPRIDPVPNRDSRVTLSPNKDALGRPRALLDWRLSELDARSVDRTLDIVGAGMGADGIGRVQKIVAAGPNIWPADLRGGWHHMGTTRMSDDPRTGVVDRDCRIHGMANVYVAGSSVFTTATSGTPTLTLVALGLRLADHLQTGVLA